MQLNETKMKFYLNTKEQHRAIRKVKTSEKKRMYRKDFATEQEYMTALNKALGNYAKWLKANNKLK
jgi:hypothetical protein